MNFPDYFRLLIKYFLSIVLSMCLYIKFIPAQEIYVDDFELYSAGSYLAFENPLWWRTWSNNPGGYEDATVTNQIALSGTQSVVIENLTDVVLKLGDKTYGHYKLDFFVFMPSGFYGYYNVQHFEQPGIEWAFEIFFQSNGIGELWAEDLTLFSFVHDKWLFVENEIDLTNDWIELYCDGAYIHGWQFSALCHFGGQGTNQLGGLNFCAAGSSSLETPMFYLDDLTFSGSDLISVFPYTISFETGIIPWHQSVDDDFNWQTCSGPTPTSGTGPDNAYDGTFNMYTESSWPNYPNKTAGLYTSFDFQQLSHPAIFFWYHMLGSDMGSLKLQASIDDGLTWNTIWEKSGNQGSQWQQAEVVMFPFANFSPVNLKFLGETGSGTESDIALDMISVFEGVPPNCVSGNYPPDESFDIQVDVTLGWDTISDATGFKIWFGADNPPSNIENGTDIGNNAYYTPLSFLDHFTKYYWKIKPYNQYGEPDECPIFDFTTEVSGKKLDFKTMLEGPYQGPYMSTALNLAGLIPLSQPYNIAPWWHNGMECVQQIPSNEIVDWVLVELRDAPHAYLATSSTSIWRKAAFLMKDGYIRNLDGTSLLGFDVQVDDSLFAVIRHRNHLGIMSACPIIYSSGVYSFDFTDSCSKVYGAELALKQIEPGVWCMMGGDGYPDGQIFNNDKIDVWKPQSGNSGYLEGDFNLDGHVHNADKADIWIPNSGSGCQIP